MAVLYPVAVGPGGSTTISHAVRGARYVCVTCAQPMVPRLGRTLAHHFAHPAGLAECDAERGLAVSARATMSAGIAAAVETNASYFVPVPCSHCGHPARVNIAYPSIEVHASGVDEPGVPPHDLAVDTTDGGVIVFAISRARLDAVGSGSWKGCAVVEAVVSWETVASLEFGVTSARTWNMPPTVCTGCRMDERDADTLLTRLNYREPAESEGVTPWDTDRFGNPLYWSIRERTHAGAMILTELGFRQALGRPWLLFQEIARDRVVFADYGSTSKLPIWANPAAVIYWRFADTTEVEEAALARGIIRRCRAAGAAVRLSGPRAALDVGGSESTLDPREYVNAAQLLALLNAAIPTP